MPKTLCIYHANCADGLGAAWAVHRALGQNVEFVAAAYGEPHPGAPDFNNYAGRDILIVDFSYPLEVLKAMAQEARSVLVLDHHQTAQEDLAQIPDLAEGTWEFWSNPKAPKPESNLAAIFDLNRSGAGLAWDYLHLTKSPHCDCGDSGVCKPECPRYEQKMVNHSASRPHIINLIEDRDLWRFRFGDESRAFHAVLAGYDWTDLPAMFSLLDEWNSWDDKRLPYEHLPWNRLLAEGRAILRANTRAVASAVAASRRTIKIAGHVVPCANVPGSMASDAGHLLCNVWTDPNEIIDTYWEVEDGLHYPIFSATYYDGADGKRHFSLRSPDGGADVGAIAKSIAQQFNSPWLSGGGHTHAAGFDAPLGWNGE